MKVLIVVGALIFGWLLPEFVAGMGGGKVRYPAMNNLACAISLALISAGMVFQ